MRNFLIGIIFIVLLLAGCTRRITDISGEPLEYDLFVSSRNDHSVKHYDGRTGHFLGDFVSPKENELEHPQDVAFGPDGYLYVCGRGNTSVFRYDSRTGEYLGPFTKGYTLDNPTKISFASDGFLYVSQWGERQSSVVRFNANTGQFVDQFTENLNQPLDHAWDRRGNFYVACFGSKEIRRYDPGGDYEESIFDREHLEGPADIWFYDDDLFVADWPTGSIHRYDEFRGRHERTLLSDLERIEGVTFGPGGYLYACDWQNNTVHKYNPESGERIEVFISSGGLQQPNAIVFRPWEGLPED